MGLTSAKVRWSSVLRLILAVFVSVNLSVTCRGQWCAVTLLAVPLPIKHNIFPDCREEMYDSMLLVNLIFWLRSLSESQVDVMSIGEKRTSFLCQKYVFTRILVQSPRPHHTYIFNYRFTKKTVESQGPWQRHRYCAVREQLWSSPWCSGSNRLWTRSTTEWMSAQPPLGSLFQHDVFPPKKTLL